MRDEVRSGVNRARKRRSGGKVEGNKGIRKGRERITSQWNGQRALF